MKKHLSTINSTLALSILLICVTIFGYQQIKKQNYYEFRDKVNCERYYDIAKEKWEDYGKRLDEFTASNGDSGLDSLYRRSEVLKSFYSKKLNTCAVVVYHKYSEDFLSTIGKGNEKFVDAESKYVIYDALTNDIISQTKSIKVMGSYTEDDIETDEATVIQQLNMRLADLLKEIQ